MTTLNIPTSSKTIKSERTPKFENFLKTLKRESHDTSFKAFKKAYTATYKDTQFITLSNPDTKDSVTIYTKWDSVHRVYSNAKLMAI
jgi:hypothetical protein